MDATEFSTTWEIIAASQISSASASFVASSVMITMLVARTQSSTTVRQGGGTTLTLLSSPYHRIIFGITLSDWSQSLSLLIGPFVPPASVPQAFWAVGNQFTCTSNGLLFTLGVTCTPMYAFFLCFFCLCKVKWSMTNEIFAKKFEWKIHIFICLFNIVISTAALASKSYNTHSASGSVCALANTPTGCKQHPEIYGQCDATIEKYSFLLTIVSHMLVNFFCLVGIITCMTKVYWHVLAATRSLPETKMQVNVTDGNINATPAQAANDSEESTSALIHSTKQQFKVEMLAQAALYMLGFFLTNILTWVTALRFVFVTKQFGTTFTLLMSLFFPLGGIFNILIYTRPKVVIFRRNNPHISRIRAFILVVKSGSVVPMVPTEVAERISEADQEQDVDRSSEVWNSFRSISTPQPSLGDGLSGATMVSGNDQDEEDDQRKYYGHVTGIQKGKTTEVGGSVDISGKMLSENEEGQKLELTSSCMDEIMYTISEEDENA